jgi:hypothetical protein
MKSRGVILLLALASVAHAANSTPGEPEPTAAIAANWWPPMRNVWTPIAWKDHAFRFNVLFDGSIFCQPEGGGLPKPYLAKYRGEGARLTVCLNGIGAANAASKEPYLLATRRGFNAGQQGWSEQAAPMLWTDYRVSDRGFIVRQEVFAHVTGANASQGDEPLWAWIRYTVREVAAMEPPERVRFDVQLGGIDVTSTMNYDSNLRVTPSDTRYPRVLTARSETLSSAGTVLHVIEPDGRVRMMATTRDGGLAFLEQVEGSGYGISIDLPAKKGATCVFLFPAIPAGVESSRQEFALGFERALEQSNAYWARQPETVARIETPERAVNDAIRASTRLAQMISEKNPDTGEVAYLTGSWRYDSVWATPTSIVVRMLDLLGFHDDVAAHLAIFKAHQGTVTPPGAAYAPHPGYLGTPKTLTAIDWLSDHGAILYAASSHALLSGDERFIAEWTPALVLACEFIRDACAIKTHDGIAGLPPAAHATDKKVPGQALWSLAWTYKGLAAAVRLLERVDHPRAPELRREAMAFRARFGDAFRAACAKAPRWTDARGRSWPILPSTLSGSGPPPTHFFYVDTGALVLVWAGLLDADDELMRAATAFFREGPNQPFYDINISQKQRPVLHRELSSGEPCYSYNAYHSWQLADRRRYFEGMYSLLTGAMSDQTFVTSETRHGISGMVVNPFVDLVRRAVVDDEIEPGTLHLARLVPEAWVRGEVVTRFEKMPTEYGPVSVRFGLSREGDTLNVSIEPAFRRRPERVVLWIPPVAGVKALEVNGAPMNWERDSRRVVLGSDVVK